MGAESSTMQNGAIANTCKGCKNLGNKQVDTVKLDMEKLTTVNHKTAGKENSDPGQMRESAAQKNQRDQEQLRKKEAAELEEARRQAEVEREELRRKQMQEEEDQERKRRETAEQQQRQQEEEARRQVELTRQAEEQKRRQAQAEEEQRLRRIQKEQEEEARLLKQKEEEEEALRRRKEKEEEEIARKSQQLQAFLSKGGFAAVCEKKVKKGVISSGFSYPLHAAVEQKDVEAVELLLWAGADPKLANSKKLTPLKLAHAKNKQGSHDAVIAALAA